MEGLETTPDLLFPCGAILWQECIQMSSGVEALCINQLSWTIKYVRPPLVCPETNVSWRVRVCFLLPPSALAHDDVCKSHKHLSYMAREEMRRQTLAKKQALIALFFVASIVLLSSVISSWASIQSYALSNQRQTRSECEWGDEKIAGSRRPPHFLDF